MTDPTPTNPTPTPQDPAPAGGQPPADTGAQGGQNPPAGGSPTTFTGEQVDAIVKGRIDKQNAKHAKEVEELKAKLAELETNNAATQQRVAEYERQAQRREVAAKVAAETGLMASQVELLAGDTEEELMNAANAFKSVVPANPYPVIKGDGGDPTPPTITKEEIYAIKNREERVKAMAQHPELFH